MIHRALIVGILRIHTIFILFLFFIVLPCSSYSQVREVWVLGDGEKVFRDDLDHPSKKGNHLWDGNRIRMTALYNEVLAFQVIVESGSQGAEKVEVAIDGLTHKSGKTIGGSTLKYGPAGTIELFSQHYLNVREDRTTHPAWFYGSPNAAPKKMHGWIPDALIPSDAKPGLGGFPLDIGPGRNQGFWIDIHLPRDQKNFPHGLYNGTVQVFEKGEIIKQIPLEINLLREYLIDENVTNIWLFTSDVNSYFPGLSAEQIDKMLKFEGRRHRIDVTGGFRANTSAFCPDIMGEYKGWLDGTAYTPVNGYRGPGQGVGEKLFPVGMYGSNVLGNNKADVQRQSDMWVNWFSKNAPNIRYFWYITDEPPPERWDWVIERAGWVKSNSGPGKNLPVFTTIKITEELKGSIDYWSAHDGVELNHLSQIRDKGGDYWFYNGYRPRYGSVILEGAAVDFRVNSWVLYKYDINFHFIWHGTHWRHNSQGPKSRLHQNVFQNPLTFANFGAHSYGNGDGIIFYPGRMPYHTDEDRGLDRIIPSLRLKNIRRGQQDAALMWMAEQKIGKDRVIELINQVIPRALSEVERNEPVPWSENGDDYDRVRERLLDIVVSKRAK
jgi:hypothetical protein